MLSTALSTVFYSQLSHVLENTAYNLHFVVSKQHMQHLKCGQESNQIARVLT